MLSCVTESSGACHSLCNSGTEALCDAELTLKIALQCLRQEPIKLVMSKVVFSGLLSQVFLVSP